MMNKQPGIQAPNVIRRVVTRTLKALLYVLAITFLVILAVLTVFSWQASRRETRSRLEVAPPTGRFIQTDGGELFIQEMGRPSEPAILFIHGAGAWSEIWREPMRELSKAGFYCIAVDLPPFGFSERPSTAAYSRQDQAKRIIAVLDRL